MAHEMLETITSLTVGITHEVVNSQPGLIRLRGSMKHHPYLEGHILFVPRSKAHICLDIRLSDVSTLEQDETYVTPQGQGISETLIEIDSRAKVILMEVQSIGRLFT